MVRLRTIVVTLIPVLLLAMQGRALTFAAEAGEDAADALPGDGICATAGGKCSFRAAIEEANATAGPDVVLLPAARIRCAAGAIRVADDLAIQGAGVTLSTLRGTPHSRVLEIPFGVKVQILDVTVEGGSATRGGAILNSGVLDVRRARFRRNRARLAEGGLGGAIHNSGELTVAETLFERNRATGMPGAFGGGIFNDGTVLLESVRFRQNRATGCGGGAYNNSGSLQGNRIIFEQNGAGNSGGGFFHQGGSAVLGGALFVRNHALKIGGGVFTYAYLSLSNATLTLNRGAIGAGVFAAIAPAVELNNVTVANNGGRAGSGVMNNGTILLRNTLIADNRPTDCAGDPLDSLGNNLDQDGSCGLGQPTDLSGRDPLIDTLADNGGFSMTLALRPGSPALDQGSSAHCPPQDQRGFSRPMDGDSDSVSVCDIGAFEASP